MDQGRPGWREPQDPWSAPPEPVPDNIWEDNGPATRWDAGDEPTWQAVPADPQPAFVQARPMRLGELLRTSVRAVVGNPGVSFGSSLVVGAPACVALTLADAVLDRGSRSGPTYVVILIISALVFAAVSALLCGILVTPVRLWQSGRPAGFHESWRPALARLGPLSGYALLVTGAICAVIAGLIGTVVAAAAVDPAWYLALLLTLPLTVVVTFLIYTVTVFGVPAIILEGVGGLGSLRRSRDLVRGTFWPTLGTLLLVLTVTVVTQEVVLIPFELIAEAVRESSGTETAPTLTMAVGYIVQTVVTFPFLSAVIVLLYLDRVSRQQVTPPR